MKYIKLFESTFPDFLSDFDHGFPDLAAVARHPDFFGGDIEQEILPPRIGLPQRLGEVEHRSGQLPLGAAKLFQHQGCKGRIRALDPDGVHELFVVRKLYNAHCPAKSPEKFSKRYR